MKIALAADRDVLHHVRNRDRVVLHGAQATGKVAEQKNPAELKSALVFGGIYALVLLGVALGEEHAGNAGLYIEAVISARPIWMPSLFPPHRMTNSGLSPTTAWKAILLASMANFLFKFGIVVPWGTRSCGGGGCGVRGGFWWQAGR